NGSLLDDHDFFPKQSSRNFFGLGDDFGGFQNATTKQSNTSNNNSSSNGSSFDLASMLLNSGSKSSYANSYVVDDLFGGMPVSQNANNDDDFGSFVSSTKQKGSAGDLLGDFSGVAAKLKSSSRNGSWDSANNEAGVDDLIPGFGASSPSVNRTNVKTTKSTRSSEEPFVVLDSDFGTEYNFSETPTDPLGEFSVLNRSGGTKPRGSSNASQSFRSPPKPAQLIESILDVAKSSGASLIDELEDFAMGRAHNKSSRSKEAEDATKKTQSNGEDDLESFFGVTSRSNSAPKTRATTLDPIFDKYMHNRQQKTSAGAPSTAKKASPVTMMNGMDDLSFIFGAASMSEEFEEVAGESEERRRARLGRHQRTQDR
ncbi:hypothetical protein Godav_000911, partial [Gossypium davidsonii]|nr:hypothetical protein [Gossypium davidsonii]